MQAFDHRTVLSPLKRLPLGASKTFDPKNPVVPMSSHFFGE
jgi:hypothetical protein